MAVGIGSEVPGQNKELRSGYPDSRYESDSRNCNARSGAG